MEVKRGYKQTDFGIIPDDWVEIKFGDLYQEPSRNGIYKSPDYRGRGTRIVNMGELFGFDFISDQEMSRVDLTNREINIVGLQKGDLLFGRRSIVPSGAGKCSIVLSLREPLTFESSIIRVRLKKKKICPLFYFYFFASPSGRSIVSTIISGTNIKGIRATELKNLSVPLPSFPEQRAIAEAIADVDAMISSLDALIAKTRAIKQGVMQELVTGKIRLSGFMQKWETQKMRDIAKVTMGQSPDSHFYNANSIGLPLIQGNADIFNRKAIIRNYTSQITRKCIKGDIILSVRAPVGEVAKTDFDACIGRGVCAISYQNDFLYHYLINFEPKWARLSTGSTFDSVTSSQVKDLEIFLPSAIEEQVAISQVLNDIDDEISTIEQKRDKTKALKQGMMQELLTGRIRLQGG
jgi:type I restriction enzyme, S subunit